MKIAAKSKSKLDTSFGESYRFALREYATRGGEAALGKAYELGRRATANRMSLVEIVALYHRALSQLVTEAKDEQRVAELVRSGADFLIESLSSYEMAHRGFQDAVKALRQLNETLEEEIKRIAHAVHDEAGQLLVAVHLALADVSRQLAKPQQDRLGEIDQLLDQVEKQLRRYSHELRPTVLDDLGWIPAIRFLADGVSKRANVLIQIKSSVANRLPSAVEIALYRVVQEALTNAMKHAKASRVLIGVRRKGRVLFCSIEDDGAGFDVRAVQSNRRRRGLGLLGMEERLNAIGGALLIDSVPGRGTKLLIRLPVEWGHSNANSRSPR
ncbi:MAG TPA: ATP-binding protein [Candidatus Acidoferrales bacterium]|nr:ATP-binding protein [Candidatus Acidoferrales bacterium]